ncbi:MAG: hypothetical protein AAF215_03325 [Cyanobacteria bacterium P01_A01_bin.123]
MKHTDQKQVRRAAAEEFEQSLGELEAVFDTDAPFHDTAEPEPSNPLDAARRLPPDASRDSASNGKP